METNQNKEATRKRLSELELQAEVIIDRYFAEVAEDPHAAVTRQLRENLAKVRNEQFMLFDKLSARQAA